MTGERETHEANARVSTAQSDSSSKFEHLIHFEKLLHEGICKALQENCAKYQATRYRKYLDDIERNVKEAQKLVDKREHAFAELKSFFCCKETASLDEIDRAFEHCKTLWSYDTCFSDMISTGRLTSEIHWEFTVALRSAETADRPSMTMNRYRCILVHFCYFRPLGSRKTFDAKETVNTLCRCYPARAFDGHDREIVGTLEAD